MGIKLTSSLLNTTIFKNFTQLPNQTKQLSSCLELSTKSRMLSTTTRAIPPTPPALTVPLVPTTPPPPSPAQPTTALTTQTLPTKLILASTQTAMVVLLTAQGWVLRTPTQLVSVRPTHTPLDSAPTPTAPLVLTDQTPLPDHTPAT